MEPWDVVYYETEDATCPGDVFLDDCPTGIAAKFLAVLDDVAAAPPRAAA